MGDTENRLAGVVVAIIGAYSWEFGEVFVVIFPHNCFWWRLACKVFVCVIFGPGCAFLFVSCWCRFAYNFWTISACGCLCRTRGFAQLVEDNSRMIHWVSFPIRYFRVSCMGRWDLIFWICLCRWYLCRTFFICSLFFAFPFLGILHLHQIFFLN